MAFELDRGENQEIRMIGRCDASREVLVDEFFAQVTESTIVDMSRLEYISSAPLGVLFATQARLMQSNHKLTLQSLTPHIREVFLLAGFDAVFDIE